MRQFPASLLERLESAIYLVAGYVLAFVAAVLLGYAVWEAVHIFSGGDLGAAVVRLLDRVLLALMIAEIIYTVARFSREGSLEPEPFLVIGIIASVRRMLVITAESASATDIGSHHYQGVLVEMGLLLLGIPLLALAIWLIRRR